MYRVYCDGLLLYHSSLENLQIFNPTLELEVNKTGSFEFTIYPDHPYYSTLQKMKSIIEVWQDDYLLFWGRVLDDELHFYNEKSVSCEGELAFLLDSVLRPFTFSGTVAEFLAYVLSLHNAQVNASKHSQVGNVTVTGDISYDETEYLSTHETLTTALLDAHGGYLMTRFVDGVVYLDYLSEINLLSPQTIKFGKNLLDLKRIRKGADIATVIIPLGAELKDEEGNDTGKRLTIESVNGGADFIQDSAAVAQFGIIVKTVIFDGITDPEELKSRGQAQLSESVNQWETIELTAADLATVDETVTSFHLGTMVRVQSDPHGIIDQLFMVSKLSLNLLDPGANRLTLGKTVKAFSEAVSGLSAQQWELVRVVEKSSAETQEAILNVERNLQSAISSSADNITAKVAETYALKDDTEAIVSEVSAEVTLTKNSLDIMFTQASTDIEALAAGTDAEFEEIRKYIRFVDGKVYIGEVGNELELQIAADRISFMQEGAEVAYFSNRKLYVTDGEYTHSLRLGNFSFMPRENGNLSFKKI